MPTLQIIITDAGRQAIVDATNTGTLPVTLSEVALGTGKWSPDATAPGLQAEIKRIYSVGGLAVADDTIHITITDDSTDAYALGEFGIYTDGGVLFAIYSDVNGITDKAADTLLLLAADMVLTSIPPGSVTVNGIGFSNPPATESTAGIAKIAPQSDVDAGTDDSMIVTPLKLEVKLAAALAALVDSAPGALDTLNELAAALGDDANFASTMTNALGGKQPLDATLTGLAAVATAVDKLIYATGNDTFATTTLTSFMRTLLDDSTASSARLTLGAAPLSSPAFTGTPTAPTPADGNSSTLIATTAFVLNAIATRNAYSATKLQTSRTLQLTGDVTGSASFDGTANANIAAVIPNNSINQNQMLNATAGTTYAWTQDNAELASPAGTSYLTCDEWRIAVDGTVTIYFQHYCYTANSSTDAYARVRKNGSVIATYTAFDQNVQTQTLNVSVNNGDVVDIQWASKGGIAGESLIKNRRLYTGNACSVPASKSYTYGQ